jgi:transposase InsO family protein
LALLSSGLSSSSPFHLDSACTYHLIKDLHHLENATPCKSVITFGNGETLKASHQGQVNLDNLVTLKNVLYVPKLVHNLISVRQCFADGYKVDFSQDTGTITSRAGVPLITCPFTSGLYTFQASPSLSHSLVALNPADQLLHWHRRLGHLNLRDVIRLGKLGRLGGKWDDVNASSMTSCEPCILGKGHRLPSPTSSLRATKPNEIVHIDLWGPSRSTSLGGKRYFLTCYDDYSHHIQLYFLAKKSEALTAFNEYIKLVENQCNSAIKLVRSDNGGEFTSEAFRQLLASKGMEANYVPPGSHAQNGRVERVHLTIINLVRTLLVETGLQGEMWAEAANYSAYVRNRIPKTNCNDMTSHRSYGLAGNANMPNSNPLDR